MGLWDHAVLAKFPETVFRGFASTNIRDTQQLLPCLFNAQQQSALTAVQGRLTLLLGLLMCICSACNMHDKACGDSGHSLFQLVS